MRNPYSNPSNTQDSIFDTLINTSKDFRIPASPVRNKNLFANKTYNQPSPIRTEVSLKGSHRIATRSPLTKQNFVFDYSEKQKIDKLRPKQRRFYELAMTQYSNLVTRIRSAEMLDTLLGEYFSGNTNNTAKWTASDTEMVHEAYKKFIDCKLREAQLEAMETKIDKELNHIEIDYVKQLEETMMANVKSDCDQNRYIYRNHTESLVNDVDKFLFMLPNVVQNANAENRSLSLKVGYVTDTTKDVEMLSQQLKEINLLKQKIDHAKEMWSSIVN